MSKRALVLLAAGAEEMEAIIAVDVLRRGGIDVVLAGIDGTDVVTCSRKTKIAPDAALTDVAGDSFDALVLPGGAEGARRLAEHSRVGELLKAAEDDGRLVGAICAAPMALCTHGVFAGKAMTCHPSVRELVAKHGAHADRPVVHDGQLVTSQGPGTAFLFALELVRALAGEAKAAEVRAPMMMPA